MQEQQRIGQLLNVVSYLQQDGEIFLESDFRIDYLSGLKTNKVKDLAFKQPRPILRMRTDRIFMLYKKFSKQVGDTALPTESLNFYLRTPKNTWGTKLRPFQEHIEGGRSNQRTGGRWTKVL